MPVVVLERAEAASPHAVDIECSSQVVDFVLQNARIPAFSFNADRFALMVKGFNQDRTSTRHDSNEAGKAETAFKEIDLRPRQKPDLRIDQNLKRNGCALAFRQLGRGKIRMIFDLVFNDSELQRLANLGSSKTDTGSIRQCFVHMLNELVNALAVNLLRSQGTSFGSQDRFSDAGNLDSHLGFIFANKKGIHYHGAARRSS